LVDLSFGEAIAHVRVNDGWKTYCELYLQGQLARRAQLTSFSLDREQLFQVVQRDRTLICIWSTEHVFAVDQRQFADETERIVEQDLAATSALEREAFVQLGASIIISRDEFSCLR
jgi:hypothetical protein